MVTEIAVERYRFTCPWCGTELTRDYDVQYLIDAGGDTWSFYRLDGRPTFAPTAEEQLCPNCGRGMRVRLVARRDAPPADLDSDQPRQKVGTSTEERRASVPHLAAQQDHTGPRSPASTVDRRGDP